MRFGAFVVLGALAAGCGQSTKSRSLAPATNGGGGPEAGAGAGAGEHVGGAAGVGGALDCATPTPGESPLMRLNRVELRNTLQVLFQDVPSAFVAVDSLVFQLPPEQIPRSSQPLSARLAEVYYTLAKAAASAITSDPAALAAFCGCDPEQQGADACRDQMIERFAARAYRRPLTDEDRSELREVFQAGQLAGGFAAGVQAVVELVLQSPDLLYLLEFGTGEVRGDAVALSTYETATRLSYFLTGSPPDEALLTAAAASESLPPTELEAQARRLLGSPANRRTTRIFMEDLLGLRRTLGVQRESGSPFTPAIATLAVEESARFVDEVTFEGAGTFQALFSQPTTWLNGPLAQFYGIGGITGDGFQRVELDASKRAGILTQAAFLSSGASPRSTSPVQRGLTVLDAVLCFRPSPPPATIPVLSPPQVTGVTMRDRLLADTAPAECQECHRYIDPIGLAFENYDEVGLWRTHENGSLIDPSGELPLTDASGSFANAVELIERIASSRDARACFADKWLAHAYGRPAAPADACARQQLEAALEASQGNIQELLVAIAKTDNLRYRLRSELQP